MSGETGTGRARYRAFISYSHRDDAFAARLHRRLEGYVLPRRLGGERRLAPIFKDREELPAARDLSQQVQAALAVSDCLVVVCSPDAAASPWVGREIALFRDLHPDRPILAALIRGEPAEAFPPALAEGGVEPLAADFRKAADGERLALLKLVAGIAGVGVDELVQRDTQRRLRGVMAVTGIAVAGMLAMGTMTAFALQARAEAERQRAEAEGLVEFMLTDLRDRLKGVGRLDVLTSVNKRALGYYADQDLARLPDASLERRARLLHAMGEDDANRGDLDEAERLFDEAYRVTETLVKADPTNADRVWGHGQSAYWRGFVAYRRKEASEAGRAWSEYRQWADRLGKLEPMADRTRRESAFADSNLCTLAIELTKDIAQADAACASALRTTEAIFGPQPTDPTAAFELANQLAWMADAHVLGRRYGGAMAARQRQLLMLDRLLKDDPRNASVLQQKGGALRAVSKIAFLTGDLATAERTMRSCRETFKGLSAQDPDNQLWREQIALADSALEKISSGLGKVSR